MNMKEMIKNYEEKFDVVLRGPEYTHYSQEMKENTAESYQLQLAVLLQEEGFVNFYKAKKEIEENSQLFAKENYLEAENNFKNYCKAEGVDLAALLEIECKENFKSAMNTDYGIGEFAMSSKEKIAPKTHKTIVIDLGKNLESTYVPGTNKMYLSIQDPKQDHLIKENAPYTDKDLNEILYDTTNISITEQEEPAIPVLGNFVPAY